MVTALGSPYDNGEAGMRFGQAAANVAAKAEIKYGTGNFKAITYADAPDRQQEILKVATAALLSNTTQPPLEGKPRPKPISYPPVDADKVQQIFVTFIYNTNAWAIGYINPRDDSGALKTMEAIQGEMASLIEKGSTPPRFLLAQPSPRHAQERHTLLSWIVSLGAMLCNFFKNLFSCCRSG